MPFSDYFTQEEVSRHVPLVFSVICLRILQIFEQYTDRVFFCNMKISVKFDDIYFLITLTLLMWARFSNINVFPKLLSAVNA